MSAVDEVADTARRLVATTRPLPAGDTVDLLAASGPDGLLWRGEGGGVAGRGEALRIPLPRGLDDAAAVGAVTEALGLIATDDPIGGHGTGPVAIGALPFERSAAGHLVVPAVAVGRDGGQAWVTTVAPAAGPTPEAAAAGMVADATGAGPSAPAAEPPDEFELVPAMTHRAWRELIDDAVGRIGAGDLGKVVLSRRVDVRANRPFVTSDVLERLTALYPSCMVFRIDGFVGASPELLIGRRDRQIASHPLAGTIARSGDAAADRELIEGLLGSAKDRAEHAFVVDELRAALAPVCERLEVPAEPSILELRNVSHLATRISGWLPAAAGPSALELVATVHPTPAVAGTPTDKATAYLEAVEGYDRGRYAGPVGWVDSRGDGAWAIGIRSAVVDGRVASIYAGVGVVADSDPHAELAESQLKLQALLAALVRP